MHFGGFERGSFAVDIFASASFGDMSDRTAAGDVLQDRLRTDGRRADPRARVQSVIWRCCIASRIGLHLSALNASERQRSDWKGETENKDRPASGQVIPNGLPDGRMSVK
jgi:hypothetical protein